MDKTLPPLYSAVGLKPEYAIIDKAVTGITLEERILSLSSDDFTITSLDGRTVGHCKGKLLSLHAKKEMTDANGKTIYRLQHVNTFTSSLFRATAPGYVVFDAAGNEVMAIVAPPSGKVKLTAHFKNCYDHSDTVINIIKDSHIEARMILGEQGDGPVIGEIHRDGGYLKDMVKCAQTYSVDIAPGLDWTLAAALTICYDHTRPSPLVVAPAVATG